jgi:hypothetical protein
LHNPAAWTVDEQWMQAVIRIANLVGSFLDRFGHPLRLVRS